MPKNQALISYKIGARTTFQSLFKTVEVVHIQPSMLVQVQGQITADCELQKLFDTDQQMVSHHDIYEILQGKDNSIILPRMGYCSYEAKIKHVWSSATHL